MTDTQNPKMSAAETNLARVRAALMEFGADPDAVDLVGDRGYFDPNRISAETAWRAAEVAHVTTPLCWACFRHGHIYRPAHELCEASRRLTHDCGVRRDP